MFVTSTLKIVLLFNLLALGPFVTNGVPVGDSQVDETPSVGGDGPWTGHLDKQITDMEVQKDKTVQDLVKHTEEKLHDVEHKAQEEQTHVVEHEQTVTQDIQTRKTIDQNVAIRQDIDHKIGELEKQQHELKQNSFQELYDLQKKMYDLELQWREVQLLTAHRILDNEKQKHELALRKQELELGVALKAHEMALDKHGELRRNFEHERGQDSQPLYNDKRDWQYLDVERRPWEQDQSVWHNHHDGGWYGHHHHHHGVVPVNEPGKIVRKRQAPNFDPYFQHHHYHHHQQNDPYFAHHNHGHFHQHGPGFGPHNCDHESHNYPPVNDNAHHGHDFEHHRHDQAHPNGRDLENPNGQGHHDGQGQETGSTGVILNPETSSTGKYPNYGGIGTDSEGNKNFDVRIDSSLPNRGVSTDSEINKSITDVFSSNNGGGGIEEP